MKSVVLDVLAPMAPEDTTVVRMAKGDKRTTLELFASTRDRLKDLKESLLGDESASFDELLNELADRVTRKSSDIAAVEKRLRAVESCLALIVDDPKNGYLFRADGKVDRGVEGKAGEPRPGLFEDGKQHGAYVKAPSGNHLSERDGTLPDAVREYVEAEAREFEKAAKLLAKKKGGA